MSVQISIQYVIPKFQDSEHATPDSNRSCYASAEAPSSSMGKKKTQHGITQWDLPFVWDSNLCEWKSSPCTGFPLQVHLFSESGAELFMPCQQEWSWKPYRMSGKWGYLFCDQTGELSVYQLEEEKEQLTASSIACSLTYNDWVVLAVPRNRKSTPQPEAYKKREA